MSGECDMCGEHATDCQCAKKRANKSMERSLRLMRFRLKVAESLDDFVGAYDGEGYEYGIDHDDLLAELKALIIEVERDA